MNLLSLFSMSKSTLMMCSVISDLWQYASIMLLFCDPVIFLLSVYRKCRIRRFQKLQVKIHIDG